MSLDWEGLRTFACVCQAGNMSAAARELGVNQTTISRRIAKLEEWVGYPVLHREGRTISPTSRALALLQTAQEMQRTVTGLIGNVPDQEGSGKPVSGIVRLTGVDAILEHCVAPRLSQFREAFPQVSLELIGANRNLSLPQRETDIAIRLARPESGAFHIRRLGALEYAVYCNANGQDAGEINPAELPWVDLDDFFADKPEQIWLGESFPDRTTLGFANRASIMVSMMRGHACCALLPVCVGENFGWLSKVGGFAPTGREVWLLTHQDKRHLPQVRAVADWLAGSLPDDRTIRRS